MTMTRRKMAVVFGLVLLLLLAGGGGVWIFLRASRPETLYDRARRAGFGIERPLGSDVGSSYAHYADGDPAFRHWLLSMLENPKEHWLWCLPVFEALMYMKEPAALGEATRDILAWLEPKLSDRPGYVELHVRNELWFMLLRSDIPEPESIEILKRLYGDKWRVLLANRKDGLVYSGPYEREFAARAKQLLKYADETEGKPSGAGAPQATPTAPGRASDRHTAMHTECECSGQCSCLCLRSGSGVRSAGGQPVPGQRGRR